MTQVTTFPGPVSADCVCKWCSLDGSDQREVDWSIKGWAIMVLVAEVLKSTVLAKLSFGEAGACSDWPVALPKLNKTSAQVKNKLEIK